MDRVPVLAWLQTMGDLNIRPDQPDDVDRLEQLLAKCQSELERHVLQAIIDAGFPLPASAQETIYEPNGGPLAIADFYYDPKIVVFVDGSPHYMDYVQVADERKRRRLAGLGYRVQVIRGSSMQSDIESSRWRLTIL